MALDTQILQKLCEDVLHDCKGYNEGDIAMGRDWAWANLTHSTLPKLEEFLCKSNASGQTPAAERKE